MISDLHIHTEYSCDSEAIMEINTSSLRKGLATSLPDLDLLRLYKNSGGTDICYHRF